MAEHKFPYVWELSDLKKIPKNGGKVFSCFSCGGGSSMGYKLAGFDVIGNVEIDKDMMKLYQKNLHPKHPYLMDIREFLRREDLPGELFHIDILDGSPPCSVFSLNGAREKGWNREKIFREGQAKQKLDDLFFWFIAVAKKLRPKAVIAENVPGLLMGNAKGYVNEILRDFYDAGYTGQIFRLNSATMGVPQRRERVFFIFHRIDLPYGKLNLQFNEPPIYFREIREPVGDKKGVTALVSKLLSQRIHSDKDLGSINSRVIGKNTQFSNKIIHDDEVAPTIVAGGGMYRDYDALALTAMDYIKCQTFPQDYDFLDQTPKYVCGMSVPPVMMAQISSKVYEQWLGRK